MVGDSAFFVSSSSGGESSVALFADSAVGSSANRFVSGRKVKFESSNVAAVINVQLATRQAGDECDSTQNCRFNNIAILRFRR